MKKKIDNEVPLVLMNFTLNILLRNPQKANRKNETIKLKAKAE